MQKKQAHLDYAEKIGTELLMAAVPVLSSSSILRGSAIHTMNLYLKHRRPPSENHQLPPGVHRDLKDFSGVINHTADRILSHGLSKPVLRSAARNLVNGIMVQANSPAQVEAFRAHNQVSPPSFLVISPGKACNLHCTGCYASAGEGAETMNWSTFNRIITEAKELWGIRFIVISGGEPLAYRSEGRNMLDAFEQHPDVFFLMYTNGTLIDPYVARRMAELGNVTPAISVEGWQERTDCRRGEGMFNRILNAMDRLRIMGVPFGISLTATRENVEEIFSDSFLDYFFEKKGALYGWIFHYMPIGRSYTLDLMPTPEQRVWMWKRIWNIIDEKHLFLADFWNHGTLSEGCLAAGRSVGGGYFYIDWNGAVSPCVFVPYSPVNICEIYASGGNLNDIWQAPFFSGIRKWQKDYRQGDGNWLSPCIIRDHHRDFRNLVGLYEPEPTDENARAALLDMNYTLGMAEYDRNYQNLSNPLWQVNYLDNINFDYKKQKLHHEIPLDGRRNTHD